MAVRGLLRGDTGRAAVMGIAVAAGNAVSLLFTVAFARLLGAADYGDLAALLSLYTVLSIPGSALQVAVARDLSTDAEGHEARARAAVRHAWLLSAALLVLGAALHDPLAALIAVEDEWAAAIAPVAAGLWVLVSIQRGALQGAGDYRMVGASFLLDALGRFGFGVLGLALGLGVGGVFAGVAASLAALGLVLGRRVLRGPRTRKGPGLGALARAAADAALALALLAALQNVDVIVVQHLQPEEASGAWASASLIAKAIVWVAVGLGLYLLPESARRAARGAEVRGLLGRVLALAAAAGLPLVLASAVAGDELLDLVFGADFVTAGDALPWLATGFTLLAISYLLVQHLLAVGATRFLWLLAAAAVAEPVLLAAVGGGLTALALALLALQAALAAVLLAAEARRAAAPG